MIAYINVCRLTVAVAFYVSVSYPAALPIRVEDITFALAVALAVAQVIATAVNLPAKLKGATVIERYRGLRLLETTIFAMAGLWWFAVVHAASLALLEDSE